MAIFITGICDVLQKEAITTDEAEALLFSPSTMDGLERIGVSSIFVDLIHEGTELDDIRQIVSEEAYLRELATLRTKAHHFLSSTDPSNAQLDKWLEPLL